MNDYLQIRELCHHGIKGQKWGVQRYQNADGTLTEEGKKRYSANVSAQSVEKALKESEKMASKAQTFTQETRGSKAIRKNYSNLSNEELQKRVTRLNLERSYGDLTGDTKYVQTGKEKARETLQTIGALVGIAASAVAIYRALHGDKNKVE